MTEFSKFIYHLKHAIRHLEKTLKQEMSFGAPNAIIEDNSKTLDELKKIYERYTFLSKEEKERLKKIMKKFEKN